jgi:hypothetical protein
VALSNERPKPFSLEVGKTSYHECLNIIKARSWKFQEYEKKQFRLVDEKNPSRGKNTFMVVSPKEMKGARGIRLFFSYKSILDAVIIILEPHMFEIVIDELDRKYDLVKKNLMGESFTENYTYVLWEKENVYIELQKLSPHSVRLIYVEKVLFENYKDFLFKPYESFRRRVIKPVWMKDL